MLKGSGEEDIFSKGNGDELIEEKINDVNSNNLNLKIDASENEVNNLQIGKLQLQSDDTRPTKAPLDGILEVHITDHQKIGDGLQSFYLFTMITKTDLSVFRSKEMIVKRRFSDFLGLYEKLLSKHLSAGIMVPCPPEKNPLSSTKLKIAKQSTNENEFIEHRQIALSRFMERVIRHPILRQDPILHEFLEFDGDLPKATSTQAFSSASAMKFIKSVGDVVNKISFQMDESDEFFTLKSQELNNWEYQIGQLVTVLSTITTNRQELASSIVLSSKALNGLSSVENDTSLSKALNSLSQVYDQLAEYETVHAEANSTYLYDVTKDLLNMIYSGRTVLDERIRIFKLWKDTESNLTSKRIMRGKIEMNVRADKRKLPLLEGQIKELESKVDELNVAFENISKTIKSEFERFDYYRFTDFKGAMISYLEVLAKLQEKAENTWATYINHAKSIEAPV